MSGNAELTPVILAAPLSQAQLTGVERVRAQRALAIEALQHSARRCGARLSELCKDADDAPLPSNGWHWSISHTRAFSAGVVSRVPVGIDIEPIAARQPAIVARVMDAREIALLSGSDWPTFVRVWTAKEAVLKKAGIGLAELALCRVVARAANDGLLLLHRACEHLVLQSRHAEHIASVCADDRPSVAWEWSA